MPLVVRSMGHLDVPVAICDHCGEEIEDARSGHYQWMVDPTRTVDQQVFFTHTKCRRAFEAVHTIYGWWGAADLQLLPVFLLTSLKLNVDDAKAVATRVGSLEDGPNRTGPELNRRQTFGESPRV